MKDISVFIELSGNCQKLLYVLALVEGLRSFSGPYNFFFSQKAAKIELAEVDNQLKNLSKENETLRENWEVEKQNVLSLQSSLSLLNESQMDEQTKVILNLMMIIIYIL